MNCKRSFKIIRIKKKRHTHCDMSFLVLEIVGSYRLVGLLGGICAYCDGVSLIYLYWTNSSFSKRSIQIQKNVVYLYYKGGNAHGC